MSEWFSGLSDVDSFFGTGRPAALAVTGDGAAERAAVTASFLLSAVSAEGCPPVLVYDAHGFLSEALASSEVSYRVLCPFRERVSSVNRTPPSKARIEQTVTWRFSCPGKWNADPAALVECLFGGLEALSEPDLADVLQQVIGQAKPGDVRDLTRLAAPGLLELVLAHFLGPDASDRLFYAAGRLLTAYEPVGYEWSDAAVPMTTDAFLDGSAGRVVVLRPAGPERGRPALDLVHLAFVRSVCRRGRPFVFVADSPLKLFSRLSDTHGRPGDEEALVTTGTLDGVGSCVSLEPEALGYLEWAGILFESADVVVEVSPRNRSGSFDVRCRSYDRSWHTRFTTETSDA